MTQKKLLDDNVYIYERNGIPPMQLILKRHRAFMVLWDFDFKPHIENGGACVWDHHTTTSIYM